MVCISKLGENHTCGILALSTMVLAHAIPCWNIFHSLAATLFLLCALHPGTWYVHHFPCLLGGAPQPYPSSVLHKFRSNHEATCNSQGNAFPHKHLNMNALQIYNVGVWVWGGNVRFYLVVLVHKQSLAQRKRRVCANSKYSAPHSSGGCFSLGTLHAQVEQICRTS